MKVKRFQIHSGFHFYGALAVILSALILTLLLAFSPPESGRWGRFYPGCALHKLSGYYCGGCGGTRAVGALARGQFRQAIAYNPLAIFLLLPIVSLWILHVFVYGWSGKAIVPWNKIPCWLYLSVIILFFIFTIARNIPVSPWESLAPHELGH